MEGSPLEKLADDIGKVADDLLSIEINTIIKSDMSASKMPVTSRLILYEISRYYDFELKDFGIREPVYWDFAGMRSFQELQERAEIGIGKLQNLSKDQQKDNEKKIKMLERIVSNSSNIVGMFKILEKNFKEKNKDYREIPKKNIDELLKLKESNQLVPAASHYESKMWNNDIDRATMNQIDDLHLDKDSVLMIGKAWDIGTEHIMLQTIIHLDGDVTTRISDGIFEKYSVDTRNIILNIHNASINTSVGMWSTIVKTLSEFAGFGKK